MSDKKDNTHKSNEYKNLNSNLIDIIEDSKKNKNECENCGTLHSEDDDSDYNSEDDDSEDDDSEDDDKLCLKMSKNNITIAKANLNILKTNHKLLRKIRKLKEKIINIKYSEEDNKLP